MTPGIFVDLGPKTCSNCGAEKAIRVRERKPGATGGMAQSFAGDYRLCRTCLERCKSIGAIDFWQEASKRPRRQERVTVFAKTFAWLQASGKVKQ